MWLAALLPCTLQATERWQSDDYLIQSFMEVAMKREYGHEAQVRFSRWQGPIRLKLINEFGDKPLQAEVVKVQSQHLARITGHPIQLVNDNPNLTLIMTRHQQMASWAGRTMRQDDSVSIALKEGICLANFATNARYEITRATIIIPVDYSRAKGRFLDCVVEELTQVMGLPNDSDKVFPSIFNDNSIDSFPTGLDYVLLKLAYHPALQAGMIRELKRRLGVKIICTFQGEDSFLDGLPEPFKTDCWNELRIRLADADALSKDQRDEHGNTTCRWYCSR